jgi:hypothetical protein
MEDEGDSTSSQRRSSWIETGVLPTEIPAEKRSVRPFPGEIPVTLDANKGEYDEGHGYLKDHTRNVRRLTNLSLYQSG